MKQIKVKIISTIMVLAMFISASPEAFAATIFSTPAENEIFVQFDGHGQYTEVDSAVRTNIAQVSDTQEVGCVVVATKTDDDDLYLLSSNDYLLRVGTSNDENRTLLHVERNDVDVDNFSSNSLDEFGFPAEVVERITSVVDEQIAMGNDSFGLSVFAPTSITPQTDDGCVPYGWTDSWETHYSYNGEQFTDYYVKYWNFSCDFEDKSNRAWETASAITNFILTCAGLKSQTVVAYQFGCSALQTLATVLGIDEVTAGNGYGKIQILLTYDAVTRVTYWNMEDGFGRDPFVSTCKAWLNTNLTQQTHDAYPHGGFQTETYLNEEMRSDHYDDPAPWLYHEYYDSNGTVEGPIYVKIHSKTCRLA